ncbi:MAG TPA: cytochrome c family protein [Devosia sp.]|jgi:cytochrome c|nr:cytochrome c family protein [Devosia sp.]
MDSFELNKIMGAVLGTLLFVMGAGFVAEAIYHPIEGRGPGYPLPEPEIASTGAPLEEEPEVPIGVLLASASVERGAAAVRKCQSCHNFGEGEPNKQGPVLYGTVGAIIASHEGFAYSDALMGLNAEGAAWTYENLNEFLTRPAGFAPGTKMNFAGIRTAEERADIMAYLQTLSANPVPFPAAEVVAVDADEPAPGTEPADAAAEAAATQQADETTPTDPLADDLQNVAEPTAPAEVVDTPTVTQTESPVVGTPTGSGTPAPISGANPMVPASPAPASAAPAQGGSTVEAQ